MTDTLFLCMNSRMANFKNRRSSSHSSTHSKSQSSGFSSSHSKGAHKTTSRSNRPANSQKSGGGHPGIGMNKSWRQVAGTHAIRELIQANPKTIKSLVLSKNWGSSADLRQIVDQIKPYQVQISEVSDVDLQKMCPSHQGAVAFSDYHPHFDVLEAGWEQNSMIVALDGVEDPHNLGAVLRTSWLMGVHGVIVPEDRAVGLTATVHKVACGGVEHVPLAKTNNFADPFKTLKEAGFWVFGMSHKAKKTIHDLKVPEKVIWVMGAEDKGLRIPTERACDELISIPQISADASYNVSVATAIVLSETRRQWAVHKSK